MLGMVSGKMRWTIFYSILAVVSAVAGYLKGPLFYYLAIVLALVSFYWVRKEWKNAK